MCTVLQVVAAALLQGGEEGLHKLVRTFRQVFVAACQPKYLPANWAVDAVDSREFGEYSVYAREDAQAAAAAGMADREAAGVLVEGKAGLAAAEGTAGRTVAAGETAAAVEENGAPAEALSHQAESQLDGGVVLAVNGQHAADTAGLSIFARQGAQSVQ